MARCHTLLICAHLCHLWEALLCQKFPCIPCVLWESLSSHGFLLRRVWHLAIPTPPAMGYSPTEYAEFTEPPTEMSSHGFHRFTQILRVRCSPTEYRIWQRGYGRDAIPSYICAHLCHLWEVLLCQKFPCVPCVLWESLSSHGFHRSAQILRVRCSPTEFTEYTEFGSVGMAGMPYPPTSVSSVGVLSLQEVLCIRCIPWELLHRLFCWCSRDCCTPWRNPQK